ncbi:hypothetical protein, partial [Pantoea ananatis]|uniref:hypothetical protein n=1 Tax=Pantoea ananas TaxID=553 RepID=UPI0021F6D9DD
IFSIVSRIKNLRKRTILRRDKAQSEDISGSIQKYVTGVAERWQRGHGVKEAFRHKEFAWRL